MDDGDFCVASIMGEIQRIHECVVSIRESSVMTNVYIPFRCETFPSHFQLTLISIFDFQFNLELPKKCVFSKRFFFARVLYTPPFLLLALAVSRLIC